MTTATQTNPATSTLDVYQLTNAAEVRAFLAAHSFLEPLLAEASAQLPKYFPDASLRLSVEYDPEGDAHGQLVLEAIVPGWSADSAQDALDDFADKWWLDRYEQAQNRLHIDIAFG